MEYTALFIWLSLCLLLGGVLHSVTAGALTHRLVRLLAAPGMIIRKYTMTLTALAFGATVTRVRVYDLSTPEISFEAEGVSSVSKVLVPLAPLFGCAAAVTVLNSLFGNPLNFSYAPPHLSSLDSGGLKGFLAGTWSLLSSVVRQGARADWHSFKLYVLFALIFSLALGACSSIDGAREAMLGAALLAVGLALVSAMASRPGLEGAVTPAWFVRVRDVIISSSGVAFIMMVYGLAAGLAVGLVVRIYEMVTRTGGRTRSRSRSLPASEESRLAA